jgi:hypothetical protein
MMCGCVEGVGFGGGGLVWLIGAVAWAASFFFWCCWLAAIAAQPLATRRTRRLSWARFGRACFCFALDNKPAGILFVFWGVCRVHTLGDGSTCLGTWAGGMYVPPTTIPIYCVMVVFLSGLSPHARPQIVASG